MMPRLVCGLIVVLPVLAWPRLTLAEFAVCVALSVGVALCMPDHWKD